MDVTSLVYWDHSNNTILLINLAITIGLFTSLRLFSGAVAHINPTDELIKKDNPAFGISIAGAALGVTIVLSGAIYGDPIYNVEDSVIAVGFYGILGIILMAVTRLIFDKFSLPALSIREEIVKGNVAAGIVDAGNVVATAIVIRAVMVWVNTNSLEGVQAVLIGYVISQLLLTVVSYIHIRAFAYNNEGKSMQECIHGGSSALAIRFAGRRVGTAFAIAAASSIMVYEYFDVNLLLTAWAGVSLILIAIVGILAYIANQVILFRIDVDDEVVNQNNMALGVLQCVIYVSMGFLVAELVSS